MGRFLFLLLFLTIYYTENSARARSVVCLGLEKTEGGGAWNLLAGMRCHTECGMVGRTDGKHIHTQVLISPWDYGCTGLSHE